MLGKRETRSLTLKYQNLSYSNPSSPALCGQEHFYSGLQTSQNTYTLILSRNLGTTRITLITIHRSVAILIMMKNIATLTSQQQFIPQPKFMHPYSARYFYPAEQPNLTGYLILVTKMVTAWIGSQSSPKLHKPMGRLGQWQTSSPLQLESKHNNPLLPSHKRSPLQQLHFT